MCLTLMAPSKFPDVVIGFDCHQRRVLRQWALQRAIVWSSLGQIRASYGGKYPREADNASPRHSYAVFSSPRSNNIPTTRRRSRSTSPHEARGRACLNSHLNAGEVVRCPIESHGRPRSGGPHGCHRECSGYVHWDWRILDRRLTSCDTLRGRLLPLRRSRQWKPA